MAAQAIDALDAPLGQLLYHYTSAEKGLSHVLSTGTLRLSPFESMNDPREAKEWAVTVVTSDPTYGGVDLNEIAKSFNNELKSKVKVTCLTADVLPEGRRPSLLDRGWAHPRMWAYYAENHRGLCLVFRGDRLIDRFERSFDGTGTLISDAVNYSDQDPLGTKAFMVDAALVRRQGIGAVLAEHAARHARDLFFTKLTDWASENEFRLLLKGRDAEPAYFEFGDALVGICLGHHWTPERDDQLFSLCRDRHVKVSKVWWRNGHPDIGPYVIDEEEGG